MSDHPQKPIRVLVVEDFEPQRRSLRRIFRAEGFEVEEAANGQEGVQAAEAREFDVIVSDMSMPVLDGMQMLERLRELGIHTEVILVTSDLDSDNVRRARRLGVMGYFAKPARPVELIDAVRLAASRGRGATAAI